MVTELYRALEEGTELPREYKGNFRGNCLRQRTGALVKYAVILGDGMADLPEACPGGRTPLELARAPDLP